MLFMCNCSFSAGDSVHGFWLRMFTVVAMILEISKIYWYMKSCLRSCAFQILKNESVIEPRVELFTKHLFDV